MAQNIIKFDMSQVRANIKKALSKHPALVKKAMNDVAIFLEGEVKDHTPMDEGTLTADAVGEVQEHNGSFAAVIKIPTNAPSSAYAPAMHEGDYNLGPKSLDKQAKLGKPVGKKFITNPIDNNHGEILARIQHNLKVENYG